MLASVLAIAVTLADPVPVDPDNGAASMQDLLELASALHDAGETRLARRTLIHVADSPDASPLDRDHAENVLQQLPGLPGGANPATVRLLGWHTGAAVAVSPLIASTTDRGGRAGVVVAGMTVLGVGAFAGTFAYARHTRITPARTTLIVGAEQLAGLHGAALASMVADGRWYGRYAPIGFAAGTLVAAVPAMILAQRHLDDSAVVSSYTGAVWGGLIAGGLMLSAVIEPGDDRATWAGLVVGADVGAAVGYGLGRALNLDRDELRMANIGGLFGLGATWLVAYSTQYDILWTRSAFAAAAITGSFLGGTAGVLIVRNFGTPRSPRAVAVTPTLAPVPGGATAGFHLNF